MRHLIPSLIILGACLGGPTAVAAAPENGLPPPVLPQGVGVNIHFTRGHDKDLDMIAAAGFQFIRMDFSWGGTERRKGEYNWSAYDELTGNLEKRGLRAIYILDYSNGQYEDTITSRNPINGEVHRDTASPQKPESVAAFARWAAAAARHFHGRGIVWEIWNEPNIGFWKPKPDVKQYTALALATCRSIRAVEPDATIIAPASSTFPWPFFEELFKSGILQYLDAVSVHPYRSYSRGPETAAEDYLRLRGLIERYAPAAKKTMPIVSGEWGYATQAKGGVSLETQAAFIARQQLANLLSGVPLSIWYDWMNDGTDPDYNEHNFGTVTHDLNPKPSYVAVQTLTRELAGYRVVRRLNIAQADDYVLFLADADGDQKLAAWTTVQPHAVELELALPSSDDVIGCDGQGHSIQTQVRQGKLTLDLKDAPQYLTLKTPSPKLTAEACWQIDGPIPTLVEAGAGRQVDIPVKLQNRFNQPLRVRLNLRWPSGSDQTEVSLKPGEAGRATLVLKPTRRSEDGIPLTLSAEFQQNWNGNQWRVITRSVERRQLLVANPLVLALVPMEGGLRLQIKNPAGSSFLGQAIVNGQTIPVKLEAATPQFSARVTASADRISAQLLGSDGQVVTAPVECTFRPLPCSDCKAVLDGDAKVPADAHLAETNAPGDANQPYPTAQRLDYSFDEGWRFVRCVCAGSREISGHPQALGLWVYGDNSGNSLRMRLADSAGQVFQPNGPRLDWTGWRWVEFDLADLRNAGHWGGADDGVARGQLRLDTLLLVDGSRKKTAGTIYFTGPAFIY